MDSSLLRGFVAVADELHFGRSAAGLFITQQGLSKRIVRLESLLGIKLFERGGRSVSLTEAGERLLPEARVAVDAIDAAMAAVAPQPDVLTVDVLDEHLAMLPRLRLLAASRPDLRLSTVMRHGAGAVEVLRRGHADVVLGRPGTMPTPWPSDIRGHAVLAEPIQLLVPVGHRLDRGGVTVDELSGESLWFPTAGAPAEWTELLDELVATFHLSVDQAGATFGFDHWLDRVGVGSAPPTLVGAAMVLPPHLPLARVAITDPIPVFWWWAMWRRRRPPAMIDAVLSALAIEESTAGTAWMPTRDERFRGRAH